MELPGNLQRTKIEEEGLTLSFRIIPVYPGRDTNNNLEVSKKTEPTSTNWGWWKRTSQNVADWRTSNESQAVPESQNSQKRKQPQQRKRSLRGSNRYRASFRPKKGKTQ